MLSHKAVDVLQADATRCGGITGFLQVGHLCEAFQLPFSSHCAPGLHVHAAVSLPNFYIAEYFYDHQRLEAMLFDGVSPAKEWLHLSRPQQAWLWTGNKKKTLKNTDNDFLNHKDTKDMDLHKGDEDIRYRILDMRFN